MPSREWHQLMQQIRIDLGYDEAKDEESALVLQRLLEERSDSGIPDFAGTLIAGASARILGAADSAPEEATWGRGPLIAAGAATSAARARRIVPDIVVTDLDGVVEDQAWAAAQGSLVFVHAHGDNIAQLERWVPRMAAQSVAGTCQVNATGRLINPGGFSDGDRACYLARALGARSVQLLGFDLDGRPGRIGGSTGSSRKARKLWWAKRCIALLQTEGFEVVPPVSVSDATHPS